jgi:RNA recognition motif-containing protein
MMKILVDGLAWSFTDQELTNLFSDHGLVSAALVIRDPVTHESRGFGFVEMSADCAECAIDALNGRQLGDRTLTVVAAKEKISA